MTPISEAAAPPAGANGADGIANGLYSIHIRMLDGIDGGLTGVMLLELRTDLETPYEGYPTWMLLVFGWAAAVAVSRFSK